MTEPFAAANRRYEAWLRSQTRVVRADLDHKHRRMAASPFLFLRCTFFRWAGTIEALLPDLAPLTPAFSVGDAHLENFGSWRDAEGRLSWGVNDFDEAAAIAWPYDLVRLTTSARLMPARAMRGRRLAEEVLRGYHEGLSAPAPIVLDEAWTWLAEAVGVKPAQRQSFWRGVDALAAGEKPPRPAPGRRVKTLLRAALPPDARNLRFWPRTAGGGSLGRGRFVVVADWRGGRILREAKALVPSAWDWAHGRPDAPSPWPALTAAGLPGPDPFMSVQDGYLIRRLSPDNRKVELGEGAGERLRLEGLAAMGRALGTLHAAGGLAERIAREAQALPPGWLHEAAIKAEAMVVADYNARAPD